MTCRFREARGWHFYPRPHMEGDSSRICLDMSFPNFYPRPHMEGDTRCCWYRTASTNFYPRPHMEGDQTDFINCVAWEFLPTPSHGGRRDHLHAGGHKVDISTHALTWRATATNNSRHCRSGGNFYPRPHMEGDSWLFGAQHGCPNFYPRPHMEGDSIIVKGRG